jgi:hypothetical protein
MRKWDGPKCPRPSDCVLFAIYFRRPQEFPNRQVKPWSQKIEPSTWLDPPIQTYKGVGPKVEGANHNVAEVGRFSNRTDVRRGTEEPKSAIRFKSCLLGNRWPKASNYRRRWWTAEEREVDRARRALSLQRLNVSDREDPFASIIRCTADPAKADKRTRSKWSRVMRYAAAYKPGFGPVHQKEGRHQCMRWPVLSVARERYEVAKRFGMCPRRRPGEGS